MNIGPHDLKPPKKITTKTSKKITELNVKQNYQTLEKKAIGDNLWDQGQVKSSQIGLQKPNS